jgi:protein-tyrosine-phosphatase
MQEKGIDLSANKPKLIINEMVPEADMIIVMGCSAQGFSGTPTFHTPVLSMHSLTVHASEGSPCLTVNRKA